MQNGGNGFESDTEVNVFTITDATLNAAAVVGLCRDAATMGNKAVVLLRTTRGHTTEALAVLKSLGGIDAQHGCTKGGVELTEFGFAQPCRTPLHHTGDDAAYRVTVLFHRCYQVFHRGGFLAVRTAHGIALAQAEVIVRIVVFQTDVSHLRGVCLHTDA